MQEKIQIITDSTCDLSKEIVEEANLVVVPLVVSYEGTEDVFHDGVDITPADIKAHVAETGKLPITSAVGPAVYQEIFNKYIDLGYTIIFTGIGAALSANFQSAMIGKNTCKDPDKVTMIDSANLSTASGILILKIRDMIEQGLSREEIKEISERDIVPNLKAQFCIDTPDYLVKGGRCSQMAGFVVRLLSIKPIIKVVDGKLIVAKKPIGTLKNAVYTEYLDMFKQISEVDDSYCFITGFDDDETEAYIKDVIEKNCKFKHVYCTKAGAVISSHCGPGTIGVLYLLKPSKPANKKPRK
ncbi:MAG: DegV family protein [Gammaproteobacteria bacterium]|nr:DegV family protein [Gammaproteobacteria bacterium]